MGGWWSKGISELCFGPNLGLRLEAGTKLNNNRHFSLVRKHYNDFGSFQILHQHFYGVGVLNKNVDTADAGKGVGGAADKMVTLTGK